MLSFQNKKDKNAEKSFAKDNYPFQMLRIWLDTLIFLANDQWLIDVSKIGYIIWSELT